MTEVGKHYWSWTRHPKRMMDATLWIKEQGWMPIMPPRWHPETGQTMWIRDDGLEAQLGQLLRMYRENVIEKPKGVPDES